MKKIIKRTLAIFLIAVMLFGVSPLSSLTEQNLVDFAGLFETKAEALTPTNSHDIGLDSLLCAIDITKGQEFIRSNTKSIIDTKKIDYLKENLVYGMIPKAHSSAESYEGKDMTSYAIDGNIDISRNVSGSFNMGTILKASAAVKFNLGLNASYSKATESYFSTFKVVRYVGVNKVNIDNNNDKEVVRNALLDSFKTDLYNADTETEINALFDTYGTHFITSYALGGIAESTISTVNTSKNIGGGLKIAYSSDAEVKANSGAYGAGIATAFSLETKINGEYNNSNYISTKYNRVLGGVEGLNFEGVSQANDVYNKWISTIDPYNSNTTEIITDNDTKLLPVWDLLPDDCKVQKAKMAQVFLDKLRKLDEEFYREYVYSSTPSIGYTEVDVLNSTSAAQNVLSGYTPIYNATQFLNINKNLGGKYILMNDIDFKGVSVYPIGNRDSAFYGIFDGNGYTIKNYNYENTSLTNQIFEMAIFGSNVGTIKNLFVTDSYINIRTPDKAEIKDGRYSIAMIAGINLGTITNCRVANSSIHTDLFVKNGKGNTVYNYVGGIVGDNSGNISYCSFEGSIKAENEMHTASSGSLSIAIVGGIVGSAYSGTISDCYSNAALNSYVYSLHDVVYADWYRPDVRSLCGGIAGQIFDSVGSFKRCFAFGTENSDFKIENRNNIYVGERDIICSSAKIFAYGYDTDGKDKFFDCYYTGSYTNKHFIGSDKTFSVPSGCKQVGSYSEANSVFESNGWECSGSTPTFPAFVRNFAFVTDPSLKIYEGDILDESDFDIYAMISYPGSSAYVDITDISDINYNFDDAGLKEVFISCLYNKIIYAGKINHVVNKIDIIDAVISSQPTKKSYFIGENLITDGMVMDISYNDASYGYATSGWTTNRDGVIFEASGTYAVDVNYSGYNDSFSVNVKIPVTGSISISGTPLFGKTLALNTDALDYPDANYTIQWYRDNSVIDGATQSTYAITAQDVGKKIFVKITGRDNSEGTLTSFSVIPIAASANGTVTVSGSAIYGEKLNVSIDNLNPADAQYALQWYRNGEKIIGENSEEYVITKNDINQQINVVVTGINGFTMVLTSSSVVPTKRSALTPGKPHVDSVSVNSIQIEEKSGYEYRIDNGEWQDSGYFKNLVPNKTYVICQRIKETETDFASSVSEEILVTTDSIKVTGVSLDTNKTDLMKTYSYQLKATVEPSDATNQALRWITDDESIVKVDKNGVVTALSEGVAIVTVITEDGNFFSTCKITVLSNVYNVVWNFGDDSYSTSFIYDAPIIVPENPRKEGHSFIGWTPEIPYLMPAENLVFDALWSVNKYYVLFNAGEDAQWDDGSSRKEYLVEYGSEITSPVNPMREGYVFAGWTRDNVNYGTNLGTLDVSSNIQFTAEWIPATDTRYTVETYTQNTSGEYEKSVQTLAGGTGTTVNAVYTINEGFTLNNEKSVVSGVVAADSSLVLKVYIDRKAYKLTTVVDGVSSETEFLYGSMVAEPLAPSKSGYKFIGWDGTIPATMPANDVTVTAVFEKAYICLDCGNEILGEDAIKDHIASETKITISNGVDVISGELKPYATITVSAPQVDGKIFSHWVVDGATVENIKSAETKIVLGSGKITITAEYDDCDCKCHQGGIAGFFFKIVLFFQKLFGNNLECFCGQKH